MTVPFCTGLGRRDDLDDELAQLDVPNPVPARVLAAHGDRWLVAEPGHAASPHLVPARGRLRDERVGRVSGPPVTGDWVALDRDGAIAALLARRGTIVRRGAGALAAGQTLAANVELALVVEPLPAPNARRAERFVALAAAGGVPAALALTKRDLDPDGGACAAPLARRLGLADAVAVSMRDDDGLARVRSLLAPGATAVLLGPSGAGKSTLANGLLGAQRQATGAVRTSDGRGRHTTVVRELLSLPNGALVIDTPGLREVGLWDGTGEAFADVDALAADCRFPDCAHASEPGCAVRDAVDPDRLAAWRKLAREQAWVDDRRAAARERERRGRAYGRIQRAARRAKGDDR
ncbi:MAG TPA: ribosome small subunit-dependent GTPase A [Conexibacter sp.]|nr:ribosome small subunit-dependent GTPase A [Conexibacter sp.]